MMRYHTKLNVYDEGGFVVGIIETDVPVDQVSFRGARCPVCNGLIHPDPTWTYGTVSHVRCAAQLVKDNQSAMLADIIAEQASA